VGGSEFGSVSDPSLGYLGGWAVVSKTGYKLQHLSAHTSTVGSNFFILEKKTNLNSARVLSSSNPITKSGSDCSFIKKTLKKRNLVAQQFFKKKFHSNL
jgi:hypothetical protein